MRWGRRTSQAKQRLIQIGQLLVAVLLSGCIARLEQAAQTTDTPQPSQAAAQPSARLRQTDGQPLLVAPGTPAVFRIAVENLDSGPTTLEVRAQNDQGWPVALNDAADTSRVSVDAGATLPMTLTVQTVPVQAGRAASSLTTVQLVDVRDQVISELQLAVELQATAEPEALPLAEVVSAVQQTMRLTVRHSAGPINVYAAADRNARVVSTVAPGEQVVIRKLPIMPGPDSNNWIAVQFTAADGAAADGWLIAAQTDYDELRLPERYPPPIDQLGLKTPAVLFQTPDAAAVELVLTRPTAADVLQIAPVGSQPRLHVRVQLGAVQRVGWVDLCRTTYPQELLQLWAQRTKRSPFGLPILKECSPG